MINKLLFVLLFNTFLFTSSAISQQADIDALAENILDTFSIPGAAVGVIVDGKVVHLQGYGWRDMENKLPVTSQTLFGVGSCTKAFTALILCQLAEEGKLTLDDLAVTHLPELRFHTQSWTEKVTIRDLLAHRTGLPRYDAFWFCKLRSKEEIFKVIPDMEPISPLGETYQYNNLMYALAGLIIEKITGLSWEEAVRQRIFIPLQMEGANCSVEASQSNTDYALPYAHVLDTLQAIPFHSMTPVEPAGGINASADDMLIWLWANMGCSRLLSQESFQEMQTVQMPVHKSHPGIEQIGYGLGWMIETYRGYSQITHDGIVDGFFSSAIILPTENVGVIILINNSSQGGFAAAALGQSIIDSLLELPPIDWTSIELKRLHAARKMVNLTMQLPHTGISAHPLDAYAGDYHHPSFGTIHITATDDYALTVQYGRASYILTPIEGNRFHSRLEALLIFGAPFAETAVFEEKQSAITSLCIQLEPSCPPLIFTKEP